MSERQDIKVRNLDFSECKYLGEIYEVIKNELELPPWFGANLDALWDAVTSIMYTPAEIRISRTAARSELLPDVDEIIEVFHEAEAKYHEITVIITFDEENVGDDDLSGYMI